MLYARMNDHKNKGFEWPLQWEKCNDMFTYLQRTMWGYQLTIERRMFYSEVDPEYRCVLVKWDEDRANNNEQRKRNVLLETSDPAQMEAALTMLISEAEELSRAYKQKVSWIP